MKTLPLRNLLGRVALAALLPLSITACDDSTPTGSGTDGATDTSDDDDDTSETNVTITTTSPATMTGATEGTETGDTETTDGTTTTTGDTEDTTGDTEDTTGDTEDTTGDTEETTGDTEETTGVKGDCEVIEVGNLTAFPTAAGFDAYLPLATPNTGDVAEDQFQIRFWAPTAGDADLTSAADPDNTAIATCDQCLVYLQDLDGKGVATRLLFQSAGSINVDPSSETYASTITFTDVELVEVTIDKDGTTPVEDGACIELVNGSAVTVPAEWTCDTDAYGDGASCDCGCGAPDPDCADEMATSCDECNGTGSCAEGEADCAGIEPDDSASCSPNPLCMDDTVAGELDAADPLFTRTFGIGADCALSGSGVDVSHDVLNFTAPAGGINITADTCDAEFDSYISLYQAADGSADPFDPANPCVNLIQSDDDGCAGGTAGSSLLTAEGLIEGEYQVVVTQFSPLDINDDPELGTYTMTQTCI